MMRERLPGVVDIYKDIKDTDDDDNNKLSIKTALKKKGISFELEEQSQEEKKLYYDEVARYIQTISAYITLERQTDLPTAETDPKPEIGTIYYVKVTINENGENGPDIFILESYDEQTGEPQWNRPIAGGGLPNWDEMSFEIDN